MTRISLLSAAPAAAAVAAALTAITPAAGHAQTTDPPPAPQPVPAPAPIPQPPVVPAAPVAAIAAYRAPVLALVQPPPGALAVPQDKPVVVFRFVQGEAADPIDAATFRVSVDGRDRTALFQVGTGEAWGPLAETAGGSGGAVPLATGAHQVTARICSTRGACGEAAMTVTVVAAATAPRDDRAAASSSRKARLLDLLLQVVRWLLAP